MANIGRKIGANIFTLMEAAGLNREDLALKLNYSYRDVCRILEGKLILSPTELMNIAESFGITKEELLLCNGDKFVPELEYMKEFTNSDNLDKILDMLDEYIDLKEAI